MPGRAVISVAGELDLATAPEIEAAASLLLGPGTHLDVDLHDVSFMDSSGLRVLTALHGAARKHRASFGVHVRPDDHVRRLLEICRLEDLLSDVEGRDEDSPAEDSRLAVIVTDLDGIVTRWNDDAERLYGWSAQQACGRPITQLTVAAVTSELAQEIMQQVRLGGRWTGEFPVSRSQGGPLPAKVGLALIEDARGRPAGMVGLSARSDHAGATLVQAGSPAAGPLSLTPHNGNGNGNGNGGGPGHPWPAPTENRPPVSGEAEADRDPEGQ